MFYVVDILANHDYRGWVVQLRRTRGMAWTSDRGSISWVWPARPFLLFAVAITLTLRADERGFYPNEKLFRVDQLTPGLNVSSRDSPCGS